VSVAIMTIAEMLADIPTDDTGAICERCPHRAGRHVAFEAAPDSRGAFPRGDATLWLCAVADCRCEYRG
jgi:hypothetical protein